MRTTSSHAFDVFTATHDEVMAGNVEPVRSRVILLDEGQSLAYYADLAATMAATMRGGMPTRVMLRV